MRLYVNTREVPFLKDALRQAIAQGATSTVREYLDELLGRVELCEELQKSEQRAKNKNKEETNND